MLTTALVFPWLSLPRRGRLRQRWSKGLLALLGFRMRVDGVELARPALLIANHVSWVDIFAINALSPSAFVSKADVRQWPVIGWLAAMNETVFLQRGSRGHARIINEEIAARMAAGRHVALFPEGTTTDGSHVQHFHAALLQPAINAGQPVQPLAVCYRTPDGAFTRAAAYDGDLSFMDSLSAITAAPCIEVHLTVLPALPTTAANRRDIAHAAHAAIAARVAPEMLAAAERAAA
ncbi:lysophospholipid acyltransferase family protein [Denitromonas iodatirespirans]|uniref:lysophospholipid acyltransferase family protein n=1 Tax=Denitromonas iodatirespirans TaxID=2795389 RepID=UPI001E35AB56|nr:lysophospholipid acyltransferase family protein [Denitromonas iodatirespirans]